MSANRRWKYRLRKPRRKPQSINRTDRWNNIYGSEMSRSRIFVYTSVKPIDKKNVYLNALVFSSGYFAITYRLIFVLNIIRRFFFFLTIYLRTGPLERDT